MKAAKEKKPIPSLAAKPEPEVTAEPEPVVIDEPVLPASPLPEMAPVNVDADVASMKW